MKNKTGNRSKSKLINIDIAGGEAFVSATSMEQRGMLIVGRGCGVVDHRTAADGDSCVGRAEDTTTNSATGSLDSSCKGSESDGRVPISVVRTNASDDPQYSVDGLLDVDDYPQTTCCMKTRNVIAFATVVWLIQILIVILLKQYGYVGQDLNQLVAETIVPQLQQQIEQNMMRLNESRISMGYIMQERQRPGFQLAKEGAEAKYPVVMIPGFVTSGLEVWRGKECARNYFRQRMWGGVASARQFLIDRHCVLQHLALDPVTGGDPEGIRLRAAQGFEAADYFMANYWVWQKVLENMADMGYDASTMSIESYDWRLALPILQERDGYFFQLKAKIEAFKRHSGEKVVVTSHSFGSVVTHYFFAWVCASEEEGGGGGGKMWVNDHIHAYVNIAGPLLGVPKAATALLSGEMSNTIFMGTFMGTAGNLVENFLGKRMRMDLWSSWGSLWSMLPKGGESLWDVGADIVDMAEQHDSGATYKNPMIRMTNRRDDDDGDDEEGKDIQTNQQDSLNEESIFDEQELVNPIDESHIATALKDFSSRQNHTTTELVDFLLKWGSGYGNSLKNVKLHSYDNDDDDETEDEEDTSISMKNSWHDVTMTPLPYAPDMKIYCLYGVGLDTERSYYYKRNDADGTNSQQQNTSEDDGDDNDDIKSSSRSGFGAAAAAGSAASLGGAAAAAVGGADPPFIFDTTIEDPNNKVFNGVKYVNGDGSVPLLSLGYMCVDGWKHNRNGLNPSNIQVITREYQNRNEFTVDDPFRSPYSAEHVDILGNVEMLHDYMKIVSNYNVQDDNDDDNDDVSLLSSNKIVSDIENIAKRINDEKRNDVGGDDDVASLYGGHKDSNRKKISNVGTLLGKKWKSLCCSQQQQKQRSAQRKSAKRFSKLRQWLSFLPSKPKKGNKNTRICCS